MRRRGAGALLPEILGRSGLAGLGQRRRLGGGAFVVELHGVAARRYPQVPAPAQPSFRRKELRELLAWLGRRFRFLEPGELLDLLHHPPEHGGTDPSEARPGILLTFDDGFANNVEQALPELEAFHAPAVFFVATRHVENPGDWLPAPRAAAETVAEGTAPEILHDLFDGMSETQLRAAAEHPLITLGAHSQDHPRLPRLEDDDALAAEIAGSKAWIEARTEQPVDLFAYPYGAYDRRVAEAVRDAGFRAAFAEDPRRPRLGSDLGAFEIPRVGIYGAEPGYLALKLSGFHRPALKAGALARRGAASGRPES